MRIVSLLPSATEIVYALGLGDSLVGRSHECDYPPAVQDKPVVTKSLIPSQLPSRDVDRLVSEILRTHDTLYTLDVDLLQHLKPDLILTQALCTVCAVSHRTVLEAVQHLYPRPEVINLEPTTLAEVMDTFMTVAEAAGVPARGRRLVDICHQQLKQIQADNSLLPPVRVSFLEWIDPLFTCGHWIPELVALAGGIDGHGQAGTPSRRMHWQEVVDWQPEAIVISCCGFSVQRTLQEMCLLQNRSGWETLPAVRRGNVFIADGSSFFSRPGPRLVDSARWLSDKLSQARNALEPNRGSLS
ncbi:MAG: cobalamin-binding protein [Firmicutes bacterium]|nr:cobalamin-binding protein [Bacillota bacterium]